MANVIASCPHIQPNNTTKWVGRLKILSTATQCTLQFEDIETDNVYLKVLVNNDENKVSTIEPCADSSRYFALNVTKPDTDQIFELGLGFQTRDESMDFKMATGEFERMKQNLKEAEKLNERMKAKEDFSLADDEVLVMKPMNKKNKKKQDNNNNNNNGDGDGDAFSFSLAPPSESSKKTEKKKKKKKKKKKDVKSDDNKDDKLFGNFTEANDANSGGGGDDGWATFD